MPQPFNSTDELSLRHLPDVSDSSFSFQIPGAIRDNLLADDDLDFFKGADVSIAPLASPLTTMEPPFTVTPKPEKLLPSEDGRTMGSFPTLSYDHSEDHDTNPKHKKANPHQGSKVTTNVSVFSKPKPKTITTPSAVLPSSFSQGSPAAVRLDNLRVELNLFSDDKLFVGPSTSVNHQDMPSEIRNRPKETLKKSLEKKQLQRISPRDKQKVIGGISKTRCATKLSSIASCAPGRANTLPNQREHNRALSDTEQINEDHSYADSSMSSAAAGVAGRLVMYSQKLVNSFGPPNSDRSLDLLEPNNVNQAFTSQDQQAGAEVGLDADRPLTLSQLSPQKATPSRDPTPTPRDNVPISPLKLPTKRSISVASNVLQKRKKSKTDTTSADVSVPKSTVMPKTRLPATRKHPKPISSHSSTGLRFNRSIRWKPMSTRVNEPGIIRQPPVFKPEVPGLDAGDNHKNMGIATSASSSSGATSVSTSRLKNSNEKKGAEPVTSITLNNKGKSIASSSSSSSHGSSRVAYHAPQPATNPVPFNFQTDKRSLDAHTGTDSDHLDKSANDDRERSKSQMEKRASIPNFKAMHAAQEAELALRKENIQPVVPLPVHWETDHRLKERQKFDEKMREKGREQERLVTLRRKEREEQEEREVRELRKKAVPKAHEVPEWYKEAPKKKKDNAIVGSIDG